MKKLFALFFCITATMTFAQDLSKKDAPEFIVAMADARMASREAGRIASSLGSTKSIRDYATQMMRDQELLLAKVKQLAASKNITLPNAISEKKGRMLKSLATLTGKKFDRKFLKLIKTGYKRDVRWFKKAAAYSDAATRDFARDNLAMIEQQLQQAKNLN